MTNDELLLNVSHALIDASGVCDECGDEPHHANCPVGRLLNGDVWLALRSVRMDAKRTTYVERCGAKP